MATIPFQRFALTDPVAAQQAVQMGQILANAQAEKDRQFAAFATETSRQRNVSQEAERARAARAAETDKILASQEKVAGVKNAAQNKLNEENDLFNNVSSLVESDDPPTDSEFNELTLNLSPDNKKILKKSLDANRRALTSIKNEAEGLSEYWNSVWKGIDKTDSTAVDAFRKRLSLDRRANELLAPDANTGLLFPKPQYKGPRMDAAAPAAGAGAGSSVPTIDDLRKGITGVRNNLLGGVLGIRGGGETPTAVVPEAPPSAFTAPTRSQLMRVSPMVTTAPEAPPPPMLRPPIGSTLAPPAAVAPTMSFIQGQSGTPNPNEVFNDYLTTDIAPTNVPAPVRPSYVPGPFGTGVPPAAGVRTDIAGLLQQPSWFAANVATPPPVPVQRFPSTVVPMATNPEMVQNPVGFAVPREPETYYNSNPIVADFFNFPEAWIPGYGQMSPAQRQAVMQWIAGNQGMFTDRQSAINRIGGVASEILSRPRF